MVLEEPPAYGRQLVGPLPYGPWICETVRPATPELESTFEYEVWPRLDE